MLRGALIGCGFFGRIQMEAWDRIAGARMTAACDADPAKAQAIAEEFGLKAYADVETMIASEKLDFVDIATRPASHLGLVETVAAKGLPILLQKPVAETWDEAARIVQAAGSAGIRLMINENWRWQGWYRQIKKLLDEGRIGEPFYYAVHSRAHDGLGPAPYPNQPYFKDMPRLLVFETLVHHLDTSRFLLGDIDEVYCRTGKVNPVIAAEDLAIISTSHANGVLGVIDGNRACEPDDSGHALEFARIEGREGKIRLTHAGDVFLDSEQVFDGRCLPGYRGDSCYATQQHFIECLEKGREFETEAADYLRKTFAAVEACYLSAAGNRPVRIEEIAGRL